MGVASGSWWNLSVWLAGGGCGWNYGYGCMEVYRISSYPTPLVSVLFCRIFVCFLMFFFLVLVATFCN